MKRLTIAAIVLAVCIMACQTRKDEAAALPGKRFSLLDANDTGIDFENTLTYTDSFNCYVFRNFYNGGGVAIGDLNNDNLPDLFFCANMVSNRAYLNRGNLKFEDITQKSGLSTQGVWSSGVALADVNGDGWLDIYVCKSGNPNTPRRQNELFLNNGDAPANNGIPTFTENAKAWGLDFKGLSTHAAFFDYDLDGDLDCYLLNNSLRSVGGYDLRPGQRNSPDPDGGNRLLRNDGNSFTDATSQAGIYSSAIGFGLGVTVGDVNWDGWPDLYVSNDYFERDYLYLNKGDGTFSEQIESAMPEIGKGSMGADMADLDNDAFPEIFVTEMTPEDDARYKTKAAFDNWNTYRQMLETGYHRQFGRNVLQWNRGNGSFSEIGRFAGVATTDWSWGALLADFDNDGWKDIFVANGIGKDLLDQDYLNFYADPAVMRQFLRENPGQGIKKLIDNMPAQPIPNYLFKNLADGKGMPRFQNVAAQWGLATPSFSNGSAYGDLDNDGDLDLVVNNGNMPCFVYRNDSPASEANWATIQITGAGKNTAALGAKVVVKAGGQVFYQELAPMRGFESCVDPRLHFGLGKIAQIDTLLAFFPDGRFLQKTAVPVNQILQIKQSEATSELANFPPEIRAAKIRELVFTKTTDDPIFKKWSGQNAPGFAHRESTFSDFDREPLLFQMYSAEGPALAKADVNADGRTDFFIGGASGQAGRLFLQTPDGGFRATQQPDFEQDKICEDVCASFFDTDGDGDFDLYVGSGSNEFSPGAPGLQDRIYKNDGRGNFKKMANALPGGKPVSTACVQPADVDSDGDLDIFVGMRLLPGNYGQPVGAMILENDGQGHFVPAIQKYPALSEAGMVTGAVWTDFDGDRAPDLIVVGEWEPLRFYKNNIAAGGGLADVSAQVGLEKSEGWWNCLQAADLDGDGDDDYVLGNHGLNSRFRASPEKPLSFFLADFDQNGWNEPFLCQFNGEKSYPLALRGDLVRQMPSLKKKYLKFEDYKNQTMADIFAPEQLSKAYRREAYFLESAVLWNLGGGKFSLEALPPEAQLAPVYALEIQDFTGDGQADILLAGNHERCKPETGTYLASRGVLLQNLGNRRFQSLSAKRTGLNVEGAVRGVFSLKTGTKNTLVLARNNLSALFLEF